MSEVEPLEIEILSPTRRRKTKHQRCTRCKSRTILLVIILLLVLLCFAFVLLYVLERISNSSPGKNNRGENMSESYPTRRNQAPALPYCLERGCVANTNSKFFLEFYNDVRNNNIQFVVDRNI